MRKLCASRAAATRSRLSSMMPEKALLLTIRGDGTNQALLEYDEEIYKNLMRFIEEYSSRLGE